MERWHNYVMASKRFSALPDKAPTALAATTLFTMTSRGKRKFIIIIAVPLLALVVRI
jgi:hypothetical protein